MRPGIYLITNIENNKEYIGKDSNLPIRWGQHKSKLKKGTHGNPHLQRSYDKYGKSAFVYDIVEYVIRKEDETDKEFDKRLTAREASWVRCLDLKDPNKGYNKNDPETGRLGIPHTKAVRDNMSISRMGVGNPNYGKTTLQETRDKISDALTGGKHTEETKAKWSAIRKGRPRSLESVEKTVATRTANGSYKRTEETKEKLRAANPGNIYEVVSPNGEVIIVVGMKKFCENNNLCYSLMCRIAKGKGTKHKGWKCKKLGE